ncbi:hypothetical protein [Halomicrococcus sp. NG-SE-24]|uniref:hypothetical protein n=1 Tax=Halomicrococcus sp. NG-SE-24 TaxID=3436928 RepID=UPI003D99550E
MFKDEFADQWYDLNNPEQSPTPMTVSFETIREDFPSNFENVETKQVLLYFAGDDVDTLSKSMSASTSRRERRVDWGRGGPRRRRH